VKKTDELTITHTACARIGKSASVLRAFDSVLHGPPLFEHFERFLPPIYLNQFFGFRIWTKDGFYFALQDISSSEMQPFTKAQMIRSLWILWTHCRRSQSA